MQNSWPIKKLGEVCEISKSGINFFNGEKEYVDTGSLINGTVISSETITYKKRPSRANMMVMTGNILVAKMKDTLKIRLATEEDERKRIFSTGFFVFKTKLDLTISKYLFFYFLSPNFQDLKNGLSHGATQRSINNQDLEKYFKIPVPPIAEQKRIVKRIEELFAKIDEAQKLREKSKKVASALLQSALNEIFSGPKSKKWEEKEFSDGKILKIIDGDRGKNYPKKFDFSEKGFCLFLNTSNVRKGYFNFSKCDFVSKEKDSQLRKGRISRGDVILTTRGTLGNTAFYDNGVEYENMRINSGMVVLRTNKNFLLPQYLLILLNSSIFKGQINSSLSGSAQPQLPIFKLSKIKFILPPLTEQKKIVAYLDSFSEKIRELQKFQNETEKNLADLKQSILQQAFSKK